METVTVTIRDPALDKDMIASAGRALADGQLVVFPTETVYGLGAGAACAGAIADLSRLKARTPDKPFTIHLADPTDAEMFAGLLPPVARRLMQKAWPGPLTLVVPDRRRKRHTPEGLVEEAIYYQGTVGLRCPNHAVGRMILRAAGVPVVGTSANRTGQAAPRSAAEALAHLKNLVPLVVDAGPTTYARPSTVVRVYEDDSYEVLREGAITSRRVQRLAHTQVLIVCTGNLCRSPMAAGIARKILARRFGCPPHELRVHGVDIASAGTGARSGAPASDLAIQVMADRGIDIQNHKSRPLTVDALLAADYIWVMTRDHAETASYLAPEAAERVALLDPQDREVGDPLGGDVEAYRACAHHLEEALAERLAEIL